jgi:hypothetical protein
VIASIELITVCPLIAVCSPVVITVASIASMSAAIGMVVGYSRRSSTMSDSKPAERMRAWWRMCAPPRSASTASSPVTIRLTTPMPGLSRRPLS